MDTRTIKKLIELVKATGIGELEVKSGDESVRISCQSSFIQSQGSHTATHTFQVPPAFVQTQPATPTIAESPIDSSKNIPPDKGHVLKSPMVGTIYLAATPGEKPFVAPGDRVKAGDTLCLIEAMKMFNKIEADITGVVSARLIENEQPVEFDQPLFIIEPQE